MAIINSIAIGKAKGKIGGMVYTTLKGQTIAKQRNTSPANPQNQAQADARGQMADIVLAWQFLNVFLTYMRGFKKPLESVYNSFVRLAKTSIVGGPYAYVGTKLTGIFATTYEAAYALSSQGANIGTGFCSVNELSNASGSIKIDFSNSGIVYSAGFHIRAISFNGLTGANEIMDRVITDLEWQNNSVSLPFASALDQGCAYIYDSYNNRNSNVRFKFL